MHMVSMHPITSIIKTYNYNVMNYGNLKSDLGSHLKMMVTDGED